MSSGDFQGVAGVGDVAAHGIGAVGGEAAAPGRPATAGAGGNGLVEAPPNLQMPWMIHG